MLFRSTQKKAEAEASSDEEISGSDVEMHSRSGFEDEEESESGSDSDSLDSTGTRKRRRISPEPKAGHDESDDDDFVPMKISVPSRIAAPSRVNASRPAQPKPSLEELTGELPNSSVLAPVDPNTTFDQLGLKPWLVGSLQAMAIRRPTGIQKGCIPEILKGRDCIGGSRTGSGKTVAFADRKSTRLNSSHWE